jgi:hypothetical protein
VGMMLAVIPLAWLRLESQRSPSGV